MDFLIVALVGVILFGFAAWFLEPDPLPLLLIYSQPGKWFPLKFNIMRYIIAHRQSKAQSKEAKADNLMDTQFGSGGARSILDLESKHELPADKPNAGDCIFFDASNADGVYFNLGAAQRPSDVINLFFLLRLPGVGTFAIPEMLTDTNVESLPSGKEWVTRSGWRLRCVEPMRKWHISFKGDLIRSPGERLFTNVGPEPATSLEGVERFPAEIDLDWTNYGDYFDFDQHVSPTSIAHSLAIEPWSRDLFTRLKASHQAHYEQFGHLTGDIRVGEHRVSGLRMTSMRDHTITPYRNWTDIRRYIMMIYHLDDGTCIHTSLVSMPDVVFTHLEFGYVVPPGGKKNIAVDRIYLRLADIGEKKDAFPRAFNYSFVAGPQHYDVQVTVLESHSFKMGLDQACQVNENMCEFVVNGVRGRGFVEAENRIAPY